MVKAVKIRDRWLGDGYPVYIVAEIGVNHNGDVEIAKKLIDIAVSVGCDAVKFQTFKTENIVTKNAKKVKYQITNTGSSESQYDMLKKLELKKDALRQLANYARAKNIIFLSSPFDKDSVDLLDEIGVPAFKIPSGEITNLPLIRYIAKKGRPIILATGMSNLREIKESLNLIKNEGVRDIVLLHCITDYPARIEEVNLKAMYTLRNVFRIPVGFSDHTIGIVIPVAAVAMGACMIEKHFTLDKNLPGPDHKASLDPNELKEMISTIRDIERALGNGIKKPTKSEEKIKKLMRKSIVTKTDIPKGTKIKETMLDIKRPGTGIKPKYLDRVINRQAIRDIKEDTLIRWKDLR